MSKTFTSRPGVKTGGRGASNNRPTTGDRTGVPGRVVENSTESRRGRGARTGVPGRVVENSTESRRDRGVAIGPSSVSVSRPRGGVAGPPSVTRGRGAGPSSLSVPKGRGAGANPIPITRPQNNRMDDFRNSGLGAASSPQRQGPDSDREQGDQQAQHGGGYTKFEPNAKKRQQVSQMARKETEEYERFKQQNSMKYCNYVGTTGGGEKTEDMVRRRQANDVRNQKFNRLQNQQRRREEMRESEQREIDLKRADARRKADENANYRDARPEDVRRKREEFLRQFESQSKTATDSAAAAAPARNSTDNASSSALLSTASSSHATRRPHPQLNKSPQQPSQRQQQQRDPPSSSSSSLAPPMSRHRESRDPNTLLSNQKPNRQPAVDSATASGLGYYNNANTNDNFDDDYGNRVDNYADDDDDKKKEFGFDVVDFPEDVLTLAAMFPEMDMTYLHGLYQDAGGCVDAVLDIIGV